MEVYGEETIKCKINGKPGKNVDNLSGLLWITSILTFMAFILWGHTLSYFLVTFSWFLEYLSCFCFTHSILVSCIDVPVIDSSHYFDLFGFLENDYNLKLSLVWFWLFKPYLTKEFFFISIRDLLTHVNKWSIMPECLIAYNLDP